MTSFHIGTLALLFAQPCLAEFPAPFVQIQNDDSGENKSYSYGLGYTVVTAFGYPLRCTAQQRMTDMLLQVVVFPSLMNVQFQIKSISIGQAPADMGINGQVVFVHGTLSVQTNSEDVVQRPLVIPVQPTLVGDFVETTEAATMQGYSVMEQPQQSFLAQ